MILISFLPLPIFSGAQSSAGSYPDDKEGILFRCDKLSLEKVDPMYPVEFVNMVEKGKLVKLYKTENLNSVLTLKVSACKK